jgi:hypothetical protein
MIRTGDCRVIGQTAGFPPARVDYASVFPGAA